jgi:alcohol dehydrogenase class IV
MPIRKFVAPEIVFGAGALDLVGQYAHNLSGRKVLLVSDEGVKEAGWAGKVESSLRSAGLAVVLFDRVSMNPQTKQVMEGARLHQSEGCDLTVAVGGGSPMDCAKAIGVVAVNHCHISELEGVDMVPVPGPPIICIPTTGGSSADVSQFAIITDQEKRRKFTIISKSLVPDLTLIDPQTMTTLTRELIASTGMDALSHAFESYVSNASSPLTDLHALEAVRLLSAHLPVLYDDKRNGEARDRVMLGALNAGLAFSNASLGLVHAMSHSLGGHYDTAHAETTALLLEAVVEYNYPTTPEKYRSLGAAVSGGADVTSVEGLLKGLRELRSRLDLDGGLGRLGLKTEDIHDLSMNAARDPCLATNPRPATVRDIERLYEKAL